MEHAIHTNEYRQSPSLFGSWPSQAVAAADGARRCNGVPLPANVIFKDGARECEAVVHVVDAEPELWQILPNLLEPAGYQTRTYGDLGSFLRSRRPELPGCLLIDARLFPIRDKRLREQLRILGIELPFVVTASDADVSTAVQAMKAGAADFVEKPFREQRMLEAVAAAIEADAFRRSVLARQTELRARFDKLSRREREVMVLVTAGKMNKQVAWELGLSEITVKVHRGSVMRKMGARTLADLVRMSDALADPTGSPWPLSNGGATPRAGAR